MAAVEEIVASFDFDDDSHCSPSLRNMYRMYRGLGLEELERWIASPETQRKYMDPDQDPKAFRDSLLIPLYAHLGAWIFSKLPDRYRKDPLPFYHYCVDPVDKALVVTFQFLSHVPSEYGTIYHSPYEPTVAKGGGHFKVGFLRHAIERVCERLSAVQPITYNCFQPLARFFQHCVYFESLTLPNGQEAIRLYGRCDGEFGREYLQSVASLDAATIGRRQDQFIFVLGYCPVEIVRRFAVAKTFLFPGYRNTPEFALVDSAPISKDFRCRLRDSAKDKTLAEVVDGDGLDLFKWYHENGVPQVVHREEDIYRFG
jgi:hypothetical protein